MPLSLIQKRMTCRWTQVRLPLLVGDDLEMAERRKVERHLIGCPQCRERSQGLASTLQVLQASAHLPVPFGASSGGSAPSTGSLWPSLERQIRRSRHSRTPSSFGLYALAASLLVGLGGVALVLLPRTSPTVVQTSPSPEPRPALPVGSPKASLVTKSAQIAPIEESGRTGTDPQRSY